MELTRSKTIAGKTYRFVTDAVYGFTTLEDDKGKPLDGPAKGRFTTMGRAEEALTMYCEDLEGKVKRDNEAKKAEIEAMSKANEEKIAIKKAAKAASKEQVAA